MGNVGCDRVRVPRLGRTRPNYHSARISDRPIRHIDRDHRWGCRSRFDRSIVGCNPRRICGHRSRLGDSRTAGRSCPQPANVVGSPAGRPVRHERAAGVQGRFRSVGSNGERHRADGSASAAGGTANHRVPLGCQRPSDVGEVEQERVDAQRQQNAFNRTR